MFTLEALSGMRFMGRRMGCTKSGVLEKQPKGSLQTVKSAVTGTSTTRHTRMQSRPHWGMVGGTAAWARGDEQCRGTCRGCDCIGTGLEKSRSMTGVR